MRINELVVLGSQGCLTIPFHPNLTVVAGLGQAERSELVDTLHRSMIGTDTTTELRYTDEIGRELVIRRTGGRRRISTVRRGASLDLPLPGPQDLPRLTHIKGSDLGFKPARGSLPAEVPSLPMLVERLIGFLGRARNAGSRGTASLAVLDDPLIGLNAQTTWDLLEAMERIAPAVQVAYLTNDATVVTWAQQTVRSSRVEVVGVPALTR